MDVREKTANKKRLIDADALLNEFLKRYTERERNRNLVFATCEIKQDFVDMISDFPTVDAVEVVRCRECKHRSTEDCPMYFHSSYWHEGYEEYVDDDTDHTEDDYFCQEGERKEGTDND